LNFVAKAAVKLESKPKLEIKRLRSSTKAEVVDLSEATSGKERLMAWAAGKPEEVVQAFAVSV
jgi:hypothetical protein